MTQFFRKIYLSLYWKGCAWEGVRDWTELQHIDPYSYGHNSVSFPFPWAAQPGAWGLSLSGCWFSQPHLNSNSSVLQLTDFLSSPGLYNDLTPTLLPASVTVALIQPVHVQGYNILIFLDRMHLLFTQVHFLFWQPGRVGSQYATPEIYSHCLCTLDKNESSVYYILLNPRKPFNFNFSHKDWSIFSILGSMLSLFANLYWLRTYLIPNFSVFSPCWGFKKSNFSILIAWIKNKSWCQKTTFWKQKHKLLTIINVLIQIKKGNFIYTYTSRISAAYPETSSEMN